MRDDFAQALAVGGHHKADKFPREACSGVDRLLRRHRLLEG